MPQHLHERASSASPPLDDVSARRAQIRAVAAGLVDGPRLARRFHVPAGVPLQGSSRRRRHGGRQAARASSAEHRRPARRLVAAGVLLLQVGVLVALFVSPLFKVHTVDISGDRMLSRDAVLAAARVPQSSLFAVDGDAIRDRLTALPWVRSATVTTQLPSTVHIALTEWQPDLLLRHAGDSSLVAGNGASLGLTQTSAGARRGVPLLLDYRTGPEQPLPVGFADLVASASQRWQPTYGCKLDAFVISNSNVLSAWCASGWQAVFGSLDGAAAVAAVPNQLAVLAALNGRVDFAHPNFGYVDLENPAAPAVGGKPGEPAGLRNDIVSSTAPLVSTPPPTLLPPSASATPTLPASPTPVSTPTPRPAPTPFMFSLAPPAPSSSGR